MKKRGFKAIYRNEKMVGEEILQEIDKTLDQLIQNAEAMQTSKNDLDELESMALKKMQESLLHHLIHMDQVLTEKRQRLMKRPISSKTIEEKLKRYQSLDKDAKSHLKKNLKSIKKPLKFRIRRKKLWFFS